MLEKMQSVVDFDVVFDGQRVFRALLHAMANPGQLGDITAEAAHFDGDGRALLALGCTLLDNEETMYIEKNRALAEALHSLTLCHEGTLEAADFIFLSSEMNLGSLEQVMTRCKRGTYADPQDSATLLIFAVNIEGETPLALSGPGVDGERVLSASVYVRDVLSLRARLDFEYPLGVDLIFCDSKGTLLAVPRLVKVSEKEDEAWRM